MEEDLDLTSDLSQFQLPSNIEVPISHDVPKTTLDSLTQIKKEFEMKIDDANQKNDGGKKRRYQRQLKAFDDAIKATKSGKNFDYSALVVPPGFSQIPLNNGRPVLNAAPARLNPVAPPKAPSPKPPPVVNDDDILDMLEQELNMNDVESDNDVDPEEEKFNKQIAAAQKFIPKDIKVPEPDYDENDLLNDEDILQENQIPKPKIKKQPKPEQQIPQIQPFPKVPQFPKPSPQAAKTASRHSKEMTILLERQRLFKEAALKAKQQGNMSIALVYLRHSKGFDSMINAAENGLPLDMANLPVPPQLENELKKKATTESVSPLAKKMATASIRTDDWEKLELPADADRSTVFKHLLGKLRDQISISTESFKHFTAMGDIGNANKFKKIAQESIQDLEALKNAEKLGESVPLYHYEKRFYETIDCNSELGGDDLEITVIRAINLSMPKDYKVDHMNTYVKFEFAFPTDSPQSDKTKTQHSSCNPEYNQTFKVQIARKQTKFMRFVNRKDLKLEVYIKGGFLRSDKLLANCVIKLQPMENVSTLHDAFELVEGRRQTGGKLEVKIRIREPLLHKAIQSIEHKWLIIDKFRI